jgi:hypothetical protein
MFSLNNKISKTSICLLFLQLQWILLLLDIFVIRVISTSHIYTNMPVLTRSRTKAIQQSLLYTGHSNTTISSSITSSADLSDVYATTTNNIILHNSILNQPPHESSSSPLILQSSSPLSLMFENSANFEILKSHNLKSEVAVDPILYSSHNLGNTNILQNGGRL